MTRIALALVRGTTTPPPRDPMAERGPRGHVFDEAFSPVYDERILDGAPAALRPLYRRLPVWMSLAFEVHRRREEYDAVVTWGERLSLALAVVQRLAFDRKPHVPMMYWFSKPNVRVPLKLSGGSLHAIVTWNSVQRGWAIEYLGIAPERIPLVKYFVDQVFWKPTPADEDMICSVGSEMRDYPTLLDALRGTGLRCHIAAGEVRLNGRGLRHETRPVSELLGDAGPLVTAGPLGWLELRALYARSRFVVVPVQATDTDNGVTTMLEAMAMGKPVICSRTRGQVDVLEDGVTGLFVPVGDPEALRRAMLALWNDPERARAMGARAREKIERDHTLEKFTRDVRAAVESSLVPLPSPQGPDASPPATTAS